MPRLFTGLAISDSVRTTLQSVIFPQSTELRRTRKTESHITLHFIGETSEVVADSFRASLRTVTVPTFELALDGCGVFSSRGRPEILWLGVQRPPELVALHSRIRERMLSLDLPIEDRPWTPHLTVGRMRSQSPSAAAEFERANRNFRAVMPVTGFCLYSVNRSGLGQRYEVVEEYPLRGDL